MGLPRKKSNPLMQMMRPQVDLSMGVNTASPGRGMMGPSSPDPRSLRFHAGGGGDGMLWSGSRDEILRVPKEDPPPVFPEHTMEQRIYDQPSQGMRKAVMRTDENGQQYSLPSDYMDRGSASMPRQQLMDIARGGAGMMPRQSLDIGGALQMPDPGMDKAAFQRRNRHAIGDYSGVPSDNHGLMEQAAGGITRMLSPLRRIADQGLFGNGPAPRLFGRKGPQVDNSQIFDNKGQYAYGGQIDPSFDNAGLFSSSGHPPNVDPRQASDGLIHQGGYPFEPGSKVDQMLNGNSGGGSMGGAGGAFVDRQGRLVDPQGRSQEQFFNDLASDPNVGISYEEMQRRTLPNQDQYATRGAVQQQPFLSSPDFQQALAGGFTLANDRYNRGMNARQQILGRFNDFNNHDMNRAMAADTWGSIGDIANLFGKSGMSSQQDYQEYRQRLNDVANRQTLDNQFTDDSAQRQRDLFSMLNQTDPTTVANQTKIANAMANRDRAGFYGQSVYGQHENTANRNYETSRHNQATEGIQQQDADTRRLGAEGLSKYRDSLMQQGAQRIELERQKLQQQINSGSIKADQANQHLNFLREQLQARIDDNLNRAYNTYIGNQGELFGDILREIGDANSQYSDGHKKTETRGTTELKQLLGGLLSGQGSAQSGSAFGGLLSPLSSSPKLPVGAPQMGGNRVAQAHGFLRQAAQQLGVSNLKDPKVRQLAQQMAKKAGFSF